MKRNKGGETHSPNGNGHAAGQAKQRTLFDSFAESELLIFLKELILSLIDRVANLEEVILKALNQALGGPATAEEKTLYTPKEFAKLVDLKVPTVQAHLREGRIEGTRTPSGRGGIPEWRISREEVVRYQNEGLRPPKYQYRHPK